MAYLSEAGHIPWSIIIGNKTRTFNWVCQAKLEKVYMTPLYLQAQNSNPEDTISP